MKTSIDHIPADRQEQINEIVKAIVDFVEPDKVILYGSRASNKFVEDRYEKNGIIYYYISDYDIAIITNKTNIKEYEVEEEILRRVRVKPDLNVVMYDIEYFNDGLRNGKYFYVTIYEDGILVYDKGETTLIKPAPLSINQVYQNALEDFEYWVPRIDKFYEIAQDLTTNKQLSKTEINMSVWFLYNSIEGVYSLILLVFTGKKPKIHNLTKYRNSVKGISKELDSIFPFPTTDRYEYNLFDLLKRAYIGAKYKKEYEISIDDALVINQRLKSMKKVAYKLCLERIEYYRTQLSTN